MQILRQRDEPAVIERHEAALRPVQPRQHLRHVDNEVLIDLDLAGHLKPVALLRELNGQFLRADSPADLQRLALRPFEGDGALVSLRLLQKLEHIFGSLDFAFVAGEAPVRQSRARLY